MILETLLEVVKYSVPALVVYFLMRQFYKQQYALEMTRQRTKTSGEQVALRLQAYERLTLLTERIALPDLIGRINNEQITATLLQNALLIAVQKEYQHNIAQQIYVSSQLWQMIILLKNETLEAITNDYAQLTSEDKGQFITNLYNTDTSRLRAFGVKVREAIRKEVEMYFS